MAVNSNLPGSNIPELSVSELSSSLKRTLEESFGRVRVRGELSKVKIHTSGHMYSDLKDADSLINLVCWKATVAKLSVRPEEGLEVVCTGRITTYPSRSNYQLVIEQIELAGEGALLKMLEDRRKRLAAEGLFGEDRKKKLPFLPGVIGVVTSPTGSVIRDIIHRLEDRFPCRVLVWPVKVQGAGAAEEIAAAIKGFCCIDDTCTTPRPDLVIVARGGGSLEDLMAFNEEIVVRAAASCSIPLISAVGHETDTTLIDFVSDRRAPTPTAAAEMAVPERLALLTGLEAQQHRLLTTSARILRTLKHELAAAAAHLKDPARLLENRTQRLDRSLDKLGHCLERQIGKRREKLTSTASHLKSPQEIVAGKTQSLARTGDKLGNSLEKQIEKRRFRLQAAGSAVTHPGRTVEKNSQSLSFHARSLMRIGDSLTDRPRRDLARHGQMLELLSFKNVLKRGYAVVRNEEGALVPTREQALREKNVTVEFADGKIPVNIQK